MKIEEILTKATVTETDTKLIEQTLLSYAEALQKSSVEDVTPLYTSDGVFMPQNSPPAIGTSSLTQAYQFVFKEIALSVKFVFHEIVLMSSEWAFARTSSAGTQKINATGAISPEANQELFVLRKEKGVWKIARYAFSTTLPPS